MKNRMFFASISCVVIFLSSSCGSNAKEGIPPTQTEPSLTQAIKESHTPDSPVTKETKNAPSEATMTPMPISYLDLLDSSSRNFSSFEEIIRYGKGGSVSVKVSPREDLIAVGSSIGVWLYNYDDLSLVTHLDGESGYANDIDWSPDGSFLAVANDNGTVHIWNVEERKNTKVLDHGDTEPTQANPFPSSSGVSSVAWSPDGNKLVSGGYDGFVRLWDPNTGAEIYSYVMDPNHFSAIWDVSWSYDSKRVAIAGDDLPRLWDINSNEIVTIEGFWETALVNWSPNHDLVSLVDYEGVFLVNTENIEDTTSTDMGGWISDSSFSNDGKLLAVSRLSGDVLIWDTEKNELAQSLPLFSGAGASIDWSLDSNKLYLMTGNNLLWIWNTETWELLEEIQLAAHLPSWGNTTMFDWSPNEKFIVSHNGEILNLESGDLQSTLPTSSKDMSWSPDSKQLAFQGLSGDIVLWNTNNMEESSHITTGKSLDSLDWSPDGTVISYIGYIKYDEPRVIEIITLKEMVPTREMTGPGNSSEKACHSWSPDGNLLVVGSYGKTMIYNHHGELEHEISGHDGYCKKTKWIVDGRFLFILSSEATNIFDTTTWESVYFSSNHPADELDISNNGNYLATPGENSSVSIINIKTREVIAVLEGHNDYVEFISWSPSDTMIATSGRDGTIRIWGLPSEIDESN